MGEKRVGQGYMEIVKPFSPTIAILIGWLLQPFGMAGDILFFVVALFALWGGIYFSHKKRTEQARVREADRIKQILSRQRHDWMNHVQVLMGYDALQKYERFKPYLQTLVQNANHERMISEIRYSPLAVAFLTLSHRYRQWELEVEVDTSFQLPSQKDEQNMLHIVEEIFPWLEKQLQVETTDLQLEVHLSQTEEYANLTIEMVEEMDSPADLSSDSHEWEQVRNHIKKWGGELSSLPDRNGISIQMSFA